MLIKSRFAGRLISSESRGKMCSGHKAKVNIVPYGVSTMFLSLFFSFLWRRCPAQPLCHLTKCVISPAVHQVGRTAANPATCGRSAWSCSPCSTASSPSTTAYLRSSSARSRLPSTPSQSEYARQHRPPPPHPPPAHVTTVGRFNWETALNKPDHLLFGDKVLQPWFRKLVT